MVEDFIDENYKSFVLITTICLMIIAVSMSVFADDVVSPRTDPDVTWSMAIDGETIVGDSECTTPIDVKKHG